MSLLIPQRDERDEDPRGAEADLAHQNPVGQLVADGAGRGIGDECCTYSRPRDEGDRAGQRVGEGGSGERDESASGDDVGSRRSGDRPDISTAAADDHTRCSEHACAEGASTSAQQVVVRHGDRIESTQRRPYRDEPCMRGRRALDLGCFAMSFECGVLVPARLAKGREFVIEVQGVTLVSASEPLLSVVTPLERVRCLLWGMVCFRDLGDASRHRRLRAACQTTSSSSFTFLRLGDLSHKLLMGQFGHQSSVCSAKRTLSGGNKSSSTCHRSPSTPFDLGTRQRFWRFPQRRGCSL